MKKSRALARGKKLELDASGARSDDELVSMWLSGRAPSTVKGYRCDLRWWAARGVPPAGGLRALRLRDIARASEELDGKEGTRFRRLAALRSLLTFGHRLGYLALNIGAAVRLPTVPNNLAERILEPDEVMALLLAARSSPRQGARDHLLIRVAYVSGCRVAELVRLDWEQIHPEPKGGARLTLHGKRGKTRHVLVTPATAAELATYRETTDGTGPVFRSRYGGRLGVRDAERAVEAAAKRAKLGKVSPHWLRHGHATHALERGAPIHEVQATLGHDSLQSTVRYVHARPGSSTGRFLGL